MNSGCDSHAFPKEALKRMGMAAAYCFGFRPFSAKRSEKDGAQRENPVGGLLGVRWQVFDSYRFFAAYLCFADALMANLFLRICEDRKPWVS
jgi:hypothetical protein